MMGPFAFGGPILNKSAGVAKTLMLLGIGSGPICPSRESKRKLCRFLGAIVLLVDAMSCTSVIVTQYIGLCRIGGVRYDNPIRITACAYFKNSPSTEHHRSPKEVFTLTVTSNESCKRFLDEMRD
jgi:hypothetical protein